MKPIKIWLLAILTFFTWQYASAQEQLSQGGYYRAKLTEKWNDIKNTSGTCTKSVFIQSLAKLQSVLIYFA
jgi:hypothetical protein